MNTLEYFLNDVWKRTVEMIRTSGQVSEEAIPLYFNGAKITSLDSNGAILLAPSFVNYTVMNQHHNLIEQSMQIVLDDKIALIITAPSDHNEEDVEKEKEEEKSSFANRFIRTDFNNQYTFTSFVVGRSNVQAQVASLACASNPGLVYNPLFIYGNSGLGKTHLLMAVGNKIREIYPNKKIAYISGPEFVEGVYQSSKEKKIDEFKEGFHNLDVLLVDDIQFIAGKEKTHEIFFTIFNDLVSNRKQICITADRLPAEIKGLEDRIISRFNQGLNVNIEAPEYETAVNILKMKISNQIGSNQNISEDVISYIATNFSQDVRSLEGALTRLLFYAINFAPNSDEITLELAVAAFQDQGFEPKNELTIDKVKRIVADYYGLTVSQLNSKSRTKNIATARHIAMFLCRKTMDASYKDIGKSFGKRDHSTVISACEKVDDMTKKSPVYIQVIRELESKIH